MSLTCVAAANPPAAVMWYREGSGEIVSRKETLEISHIRREQAGVYVCQANNSVGQSQPRQIELAVQCKYLSLTASKMQKKNILKNILSRRQLKILTFRICSIRIVRKYLEGFPFFLPSVIVMASSYFKTLVILLCVSDYQA